MRGDRRTFENKQSEKAIVGSACNPKKVSMLTWFAVALTIVAHFPAPYAVAQEPGEAAPVGEVAADSKKALPLPKERYEGPTKNLFTLEPISKLVEPYVDDEDHRTSKNVILKIPSKMGSWALPNGNEPTSE